MVSCSRDVCMTSGFIIVDRGINSTNALADLFAGNSGTSQLSRDPLLINKTLEQMNFDTWYIIIPNDIADKPRYGNTLLLLTS